MSFLTLTTAGSVWQNDTMNRRIEEVMGWTLDTHLVEGFGVTQWTNHLGEFRDEADVDDMLSWFIDRGMSLVNCDRSIKQSDYFVRLVGVNEMVTMTGPTLKGTLARAIREVVA